MKKLFYKRIFFAITNLALQYSFCGNFGKQESHGANNTFLESIQLGRNEPSVSAIVYFKEEGLEKGIKTTALESVVFSIFSKSSLSVPTLVGRSEINFHLKDIKKIDILESFSTQVSDQELKTINPDSQISFLKARITTSSGQNTECLIRRDVAVAGHLLGTKESVQNIWLHNVRSIEITDITEPDHIRKKRILGETVQKIAESEAAKEDLKQGYRDSQNNNKPKKMTAQDDSPCYPDNGSKKNPQETKGLLPSGWKHLKETWNWVTGVPASSC